MPDTIAPESSRLSLAASQPLAHPVDLADLLVGYLEQLGIEYVFGIPGGAIEPLYNALARSARRGGIRHILARHEAGAAFMADGYARETGKLGVCISTSGPGATNLITAVATAYDNQIPLLVITGQPALPLFGKHPLQESGCTGINVLSMFRHCTHYNTLVSHPQQFEPKLIAALQRASRGPRGPVHLSVPADVFRMAHGARAPSFNIVEMLRSASPIDDEAALELAALLAVARKPVFLIGAGCAQGIAHLLQYANLNGIAFVVTPDAKGLVSPQHPLLRGVFGFGGHGAAEAALRDPAVDLIMAIGASMGEWNTGGWNDGLFNERLVHIDESEDQLARTPMARFHMHGSIRAIFRRLLEGKGKLSLVDAGAHGSGAPSPLAEAGDAKAASSATPIKPQRLMHELSRLFPPNTRFLADTGNSVAWAAHYLQAQDRRRGERRRVDATRAKGPDRRQSTGGWLRMTMNFAAMGWAIGGAIGTAAANPAAPVVCITGDGSMLMNGQELSVAVAEQRTVVFVVLNDSSLGMVKHGQRLAKAEHIGCAMPPTDFAMLARALGGRAHTIVAPADLDALDMAAILDYRGPTLLDVHIDPEEVPPMNSRIRILAAADSATA